MDQVKPKASRKTKKDLLEMLDKEKAVTIEEADLDLQEMYWLDYFAGAFMGKVKKTERHRYYL